MSQPRRYVSRFSIASLLALFLSTGMFYAAPAWAQKEVKDLSQLIPGNAFIAVHVRLGQVKKSEWVNLLPLEFRRGLSESPIPLGKGDVDEFIFVHHSPSTLGFGGGRGAKFDAGSVENTIPDSKSAPSKDKGDCGPKEVDEEHSHVDQSGLMIFRLSEKLDMDKAGFKASKKDGPLGGTVYTAGLGFGLWMLPDGKTGAFSQNLKSFELLGKGKGELTNVFRAMSEQDYVLGVAMALSDVGRKEWKADLTNPIDFVPDRALIKLMLPYTEMRTGQITFTLGKSPAVQLSATFTSEKAAAAAKLALDDALVVLRVMGLASMDMDLHFMRRRAIDDEQELLVTNIETLIEGLESALRKTDVTLKGEKLAAKLSLGMSAADVKARSAAMVKARADDPGIKAIRIREANINNLKQIGIAMHGFHDAYKHLPPQAICDKKTGKPLLSWRVAILPFIEQEALYRQFNLNEPWDSPNNMKLLDKMPEVYAPIGLPMKEKGHTYYQVFAGKGSIFELTVDGKAPFGARSMHIVRIPDGTSNTLMLVEAGQTVPWTKPEDISFDADGKLPPLGGMSKEGFLGVYGDASIEFHRFPIDPAYLRGLILTNDGKGRK